jgi:hypothetical protein
MGVEMTRDKNGRDIKVGDYVKVVNRITGLVEDYGMITKIEGNYIHLGNGKNIDGMVISDVYFRDQVIKS